MASPSTILVTVLLFNACAMLASKHISGDRGHLNNIEGISDSVVNFYVGSAHDSGMAGSGRSDNDKDVSEAEDDRHDVRSVVAASEDSDHRDAETFTGRAEKPKTAMKLVLDRQSTMTGSEEIATKEAIVQALRAFKDTPCLHHNHNNDVKCMLLKDIIRYLTLLGLTFSSEPGKNQPPIDIDETTDKD